MKLIKTTEETFVLTKDVENPRPDRRYKSDWRMEPVWKKGTKFVVTTDYYERTHDIQRLAAAQSIADKLIAAGEEVPADVAQELRTLKALVDSGPYKNVLINKRGCYHRFSASRDDVEVLLAALTPTKKDLKDVLGRYTGDTYGGPIIVLQQLVDNGTLTLRQIEIAVAQLDPDHTVLDTIAMVTEDEKVTS